MKSAVVHTVWIKNPFLKNKIQDCKSTEREAQAPYKFHLDI